MFGALYAILTKPTQDVGKYLLGKGILVVGVLAAKLGAVALGSGVIGPAVAVAGGIVAWQTFRRYEEYTAYQQEMLETYREDIATTIGMEPSRVTIDDLRSVAHGNILLNVPGNPILAHALNKQYNAGWLSLATSAVSAAVAFGLLSFGVDSTIAKNLVHQFPEWGGILKYAGSTIISLFSGLVVHKGLDNAIGQAYGLHTPTAHDHIVYLQRQVGKGKIITKDQVFNVFMAANPEFTRQIRGEFDKGVPWFSVAEKNTAMRAVGVDGLMQYIADQINSKQMPASKLAFVMDSSGLKALVEKQRSQEPVVTQARTAPTQSFVEKLAPQRATHHSFVESLAAEQPSMRRELV